MPETKALPYNLIFLVGMPRSGTTWLAKIFDSHPDVDYRHEPDSVERIGHVPLVVEPADYVKYEPAVRDYLCRLPRIISLKVSGKAPIFAKRYLSPPRAWLFRTNIFAARLGTSIHRNVPIVHPLGKDYPGDVKLVWKSIESGGRLGAILRSAPSGRAVLILRHPCGQIASVLKGESKRKFTASTASSEDYGVFAQLLDTRAARAHDLSLDRLHMLQPVERLAWRWVLINENAVEQATGDERVRIVRYEDLCSDPIRYARALFDFCGLEWAQSTETFVKSSTESENETYYSVFKDPKAAANKWRDSLGKENIDRIQRILAQSKLAAYYPV